MSKFVPGKRYLMTLEEAHTVMAAGWPIVSGRPDLTRGRLFLASPGSWAFWTEDGRKVFFDVQATGGCIVSQTRKADSDRPEPLPVKECGACCGTGGEDPAERCKVCQGEGHLRIPEAECGESEPKDRGEDFVKRCLESFGGRRLLRPRDSGEETEGERGTP